MSAITKVQAWGRQHSLLRGEKPSAELPWQLQALYTLLWQAAVGPPCGARQHPVMLQPKTRSAQQRPDRDSCSDARHHLQGDVPAEAVQEGPDGAPAVEAAAEQRLLPSYHAMISAEEDTCLGPLVAVTNATQAISDKVGASIL